jgi:hypothetical protein
LVTTKRGPGYSMRQTSSWLVALRAGQAGRTRALYDDPVHTIVFLEAKKVIAVESFPAFLSVELIGARRGQRWEHAGGATVLHGVGEGTALMASRAPGLENERVVRYGSTIRRAVLDSGMIALYSDGCESENGE